MKNLQFIATVSKNGSYYRGRATPQLAWASAQAQLQLSL